MSIGLLKRWTVSIILSATPATTSTLSTAPALKSIDTCSYDNHFPGVAWSVLIVTLAVRCVDRALLVSCPKYLASASSSLQCYSAMLVQAVAFGVLIRYLDPCCYAYRVSVLKILLCEVGGRVPFTLRSTAISTVRITSCVGPFSPVLRCYEAIS